MLCVYGQIVVVASNEIFCIHFFFHHPRTSLRYPFPFLFSTVTLVFYAAILTHPSTLAPDNCLSPIVFWEVTFCVRQFCGLSELGSLSFQLTLLWMEISSIVRQYLGKKNTVLFASTLMLIFQGELNSLRWRAKTMWEFRASFMPLREKEEKRKGRKVIFNDCHEWRRQRTMAREEEKTSEKN